jgi:hypothetical protein
MQRLLKQTRYAIALLSAVFLLGACVSMQLDTLNKKFVAFEISYKAALVQVDSLDKANALKPETKAKIVDLIRQTNRARTAAYTYKNAGDIFHAQDQISLAIALLEQLKALVPAGSQI